MTRARVLALAAAVLAACGGGNNAGSGSSGSSHGTTAGNSSGASSTTGTSSTSGSSSTTGGASGSGSTSSSTTSSTGGVNHAPVAVDDSAFTVQQVAVTIDALANDSDPDGDPLTLTSVATTLHGTATISNNKVVYTPNAGFAGAEQFSYTVSDGRGGTASAQITVGVDAPPTANDDTATTATGQAVVIQVLANDTDPDLDPLTVTSAGPASHGTVITNGTTVTYTPGNTFAGTESFPYSIADGRGGTASATVTVTVGQPVVVANDTASTDVDTAVDIDVLANDSAPSGNPLTLVSVGGAQNGTSSVASGQVHYVPNSGFAGTDTFPYTASDGLSSAVATVTVTVYGAPSPAPDAVSTSEDVARTIDVLANDTHPNGLSLTLTAVTTPSSGTASISNGRVLYTPAAGFLGLDQFGYTVQDSRGLTAQGAVSVLVLAKLPGAQLVSGGDHSCLIRPDGTLWCWGATSSGALGLGNSSGYWVDQPTEVGGSTDWRFISTGGSISCGIRGGTDGGLLFCWGENSEGELGTGDTNSTTSPTQVGSASTWIDVANFDQHTCGVRSDGTLWCWGWNLDDQLGTDTVSNATTPLQVGIDTDWAQVAVGDSHSCAVKRNGSLWCWGDALDGQLGVTFASFTDQTPIPQHVGPPDDWVRVAAAGDCTAGLKVDGTLYTWGSCAGAYGTTPSQVSGQGWVGLQLSGWTPQICGVQADRSLWCWGKNDFDQLGQPSSSATVSTPQHVGSDSDWEQGAPGDSHTCALQQDAGVRCWGRRDYGQLGDGLPPLVASPTPVGADGGWTAVVATDSSSTCAVHQGDLWCWGAPGLLADGQSSYGGTPVQVPTLSQPGLNLVQFSAGGSHLLGLTDAGTLVGWGTNSDYQLGDGTRNDEYSPIGLAPGLNFKSLGAGNYGSCGVLTGGQLYCWGDEVPVDAGTLYYTPTPTSVDANSYLTVSGGSYYCAVRADGTLWCWGYGTFTPTQVGTDSDWVSYQGDSNGGLGQKSNGALYAKGYSLPTPVGFYTDWFAYAYTGTHQCAIRGSGGQGALYCWGDNTYGELGDGTTTSQTSPKQIGTATDWTAVTVGSSYYSGAHTCGLRAGGYLYCWGADTSGEVGDGNAWSLTPVQALLP